MKPMHGGNGIQRRFRLPRRVRGWMALLLLGLCATAWGAEAPKTVLVLDAYGRNMTPISTVISVLRTELSARAPWPVEVQIVSLEMARFGEPDQAHVFLDFLAKRYAHRPPDLLVTTGGPAVTFAVQHRARLFPGTPILMAGVAEQVLGGVPRLDNAVAVPLRIGLGDAMANILQLLPATRSVMVVLGASPLENFWTEQCRRAFAPYAGRVRFDYLDSLSFEEIRRRAAAPPADTAIFYGLMIKDQAGIVFDPADALKSLIEAANAPVFVLHESFFGFGAVGGRLISERAAGAQAADVALQLLAGTPAARISAAPQEMTPPRYDWRALHRWRIDERLLPPDAEIRFRRPSLWEEYGHAIMAGLLVLLLQSVLIVFLFMQRNRLRRTDAELARSEQRLRRITDALPVLIAHIDRRQRYRFLNAAYEEWFGIAPEAVLGRPIREVVGEALYAEIQDHVGRVLAGEPVRFAKRIALEGGRRISIEAIYVPDTDPSGRVRGFYALVMDVTEREHARQESKRLYDALLHAGRVSTMGELAGTLAHEINQPLSAIMSNAQAAKRFLDASALDEVREILPDIAGEAARAGQVIERLRALLKNSTTTFEPIDLNSVIAEVVDLLRRDAAGRSVSVETDAHPGPLPVRGDRIQLQQVVMNLMMNAFEAMEQQPRTDRRIRIRTFRDASGITAAIEDTGGGVAPEEKDKIFNAYHTSKPDGMGMGLSICRSILRRHQGRIWVENNLQGGATFYFTLPVA